MSANMHTTSSWTRPFPLVGFMLLAALAVSYVAIGSVPAIGSNTAQPQIEGISLDRARSAETARYNAMVQHFAAMQTPSGAASLSADSIRYTAVARYYAAKEAASLVQSRAAEALRLSAAAKRFGEAAGLERSRSGDATRLNGIAGYVPAKEAGNLNQSRSVDAARLEAMCRGLLGVST